MFEKVYATLDGLKQSKNDMDALIAEQRRLNKRMEATTENLEKLNVRTSTLIDTVEGVIDMQLKANDQRP